MAKQNKSTAETQQRATYPFYGLDRAIRLGEAVANHGGDRVEVPKAAVASELGAAASAFGQLVATAKTFGIVDGLKSLRLTDAGRNYFFPTTPRDKAAAHLQFLSSPSAFEFLIRKFDGSKLPATPMLANLFRRDLGMAESWCLRPAQIFVSAAQALGVIDSQGFLRYRAAVHAAQSGSPNERTNAELKPDTLLSAQIIGVHERPDGEPMKSITPNSAQTIAPASSSASNSTVWFFADGKGRIETPKPLSLEDWEQLKAYVDVVLKPRAPRKEG